MNVHVLVYTSGGHSPYAVETFSSRAKMVSRKQEVKEESPTTYMFPPIEIGRNVEGTLKLAQFVNDIHSMGPVAVLERLENGND